MSEHTFTADDRVMWSTGRGCAGTVRPRDGWRYPEDLERFPVDVVVEWDDGMHSLVSPGALMPAPTNSSGDAVTASGPASSDDSTPSLVALDAKEALVAAVLAWDEAVTVRQGTVQAYTTLRAAVREYREVSS